MLCGVLCGLAQQHLGAGKNNAGVGRVQEADKAAWRCRKHAGGSADAAAAAAAAVGCEAVQRFIRLASGSFRK